MIKSLWGKYLILLFSVSIISLSAALVIRELIIKDFNEYLEGEAEDRIYRVTAAMEGGYEKYSGWNLEAIKANTIWALLNGYEIKIFNKGGIELINTRKLVDDLAPLMKKRIIAVTGFSPERRNRGIDFKSYPLFLGGEEIGTLEIKPIIQEGQRGKKSIFMRRSNNFLILSIIMLGGVSIILSFIFSKKLTEPIKKLTAAAKEISEGNIRSRVAISGNDEIGNLGKTFNIMANNLEIQDTLRRKLTSNIAHELRTPLTAIQGELEGMMDGLIPVDNERFSSLHEEATRLKKIIEGIEELSKAEASILSLKREPFNIKTYLQNIIERFMKLFISKGVQLEFICDGSIEINADPDKLSQIIINLLDNALRVTDTGGSVIIQAGKRDSEVYVQVKDTGRGIKREDIPFIFERFYKSYDGGLGIGLTIAKELAEAHGGRIEVQSEVGKGSTFTVFIKTEI